MEITSFVIIFAFIAGLLKGFIGMGLSLILITVLLQSNIAPAEFMPILVPIFVVLDILLYFENHKHATINPNENFSIHHTTLITTFLGIILGSILLINLDTSLLKAIFGIITLIFIIALVEKRNKHKMIKPSENSNLIFGSIGGILTGLYTLNSVPASIYLLYHQYPKEKYMATLASYLVISDMLLIAIYLILQLFSLKAFMISLSLMIYVFGGFLAGILLRKKISNKFFKSFVLLVLAINSMKFVLEFFVGF